MKNRSFLRKKVELFYNEIITKRKMDEEMRVQTDREFEQNKIKKLNKKYNEQCSAQEFEEVKHLLLNRK